MTRRITTDGFISRVKKVHGDDYDLSLVEYKSAKEKVKIICKIHGIFMTTPSNFLKPRGCRECGIIKSAKARSMPASGESLYDLNPELCEELSDFNNFNPLDCKTGSHRLAFWKCKSCKNEWWAAISHRVNGRGCRVCVKGQLHSDGDNSLSITHPYLAQELMPNKYGSPDVLVAGTSYILPWKCSTCDHEWLSSGQNRIKNKKCPACNNRKLHSNGENSMLKTHPYLAEELMPNKHGNSETLMANFGKHLPWKCRVCKHEWSALGSSRKNGTGCPACANLSIHLDGINSMRNTHPRFAKELLPNRFGSADTLTAGTGKNLPWKCSICGHKWNSSGNNR
ncbi:MAG: zinc-ribbon domain-containing protein, partial [Candidatus Poseidoniales archaeon]